MSQRTQILHKNSGCSGTQDYEKNSGLSAFFNMSPFTPMLFYLKRPTPRNNSGSNCPRELKFCTRTQVVVAHKIMKRIPVFLRYFNLSPFTPYVILFKKTDTAVNNSGSNCPRELKFCTTTQVVVAHKIMKRIPVFLRYFNMSPFTPILNWGYVILFKKTHARE